MKGKVLILRGAFCVLLGRVLSGARPSSSGEAYDGEGGEYNGEPDGGKEQ